MNLFLITYDRTAHRLDSVQTFGSDYDEGARARSSAQHAATESGRTDQEIVLLGADSIEVLRRTHSRYFVGGLQLLDQVREAIEQAA